MTTRKAEVTVTFLEDMPITIFIPHHIPGHHLVVVGSMMERIWVHSNSLFGFEVTGFTELTTLESFVSSAILCKFHSDRFLPV